MTKADLIAACRAQVPHSPEWYRAVKALGAASKAQSAGPPPIRKGWRPVLLGILRSHHFTEQERAVFTERVGYEYGSEVLYRQITQTVSERERIERQQRRIEKGE